MKEWLTVIIVLLIVAVVLDAVRRMRQSRRSALRMSLRPQDSQNGEYEEDYGSELPNGGARVVQVKHAEDESEDIDLTEEVPMLMESVSELRKAHLQSTAEEETETFAIDLEDGVVVDVAIDEEKCLYDDAPEDEAATAPTGGLQNSFDFGEDDRIEPRFSETTEDELDQPAAQTQKTSDPVKTKTKPSKPQVSESDYAEPELVLVINVMAAEGHRFPGADLLDIILVQGLRYGSMNIFHAHSTPDGSGPIKFSMANMVVPGTFDLAAMKEFSTPGVSFFLTLPIESSSRQAYEDMLRVAHSVAEKLGGELKDENRIRLTAQTIEHNRSRIAEFERKQLSRAH